jgi:hypothetical protein
MSLRNLIHFHPCNNSKNGSKKSFLSSWKEMLGGIAWGEQREYSRFLFGLYVAARQARGSWRVRGQITEQWFNDTP